MKPSLAIKTLFRTPGKTIYTALLVAALTFSLFIQLAEYSKTSAEFKENVGRYSGIGYVEYQPATYKGANVGYPYYIEADPRVDAINIPALEDNRYPALSAETLEQIGGLPGISSVHKRYMTAGISGTYQRLKEDATLYDYNGRLILEGTIDQTFIKAHRNHHWNNAHLLRDVKILAGDAVLEDLLWDDGTVYFEAFPNQPGDTSGSASYMADYWAPTATAQDQNPRRYSGDPWLAKHVILKNHIYGTQFQEQLKVGDRYVFVFRFERQATNRMLVSTPTNVTRESLQLYDWISEHCCPSAWNITDTPENYLDLPEYASLKELIDVTQTDLNTFDVVYADDMTAIRQIHKNTLHIEEGRWLNQADSDADAKVCVIHQKIADAYDLHIGDTLPLSLGHATFEQFYTLGAVASVPERFSDTWTEDAFEIVGIFDGSTMMKDSDEPNWAYSMNTVFVPLASLPLTESELAGHEFAPGEFTFRVDDAWDIAPFLKKNTPRLEAMGLTLNFDDGGWMEVYEPYKAAQQLSLIRIILLAFVTATGLALSVHLFVSRKKKDYAIMRALGTPKGRSGRALLVPMLVLTLAAVLLGIGGGTVYALLALGSISALPILSCIGGELVFTLAFTGLSIRRLGKLSPLALLQTSQGTIKKQKTKKHQKPLAAATGTLYHPTEAMPIPHTPLPVTRRPASLGFRLRYICRHIKRQGVKSALAVLLAVLLVGTIVQFSSLRSTYNKLRETTPITVKFIHSLTLNNLHKLEDEGFVKDVYYENITFLGFASGATLDEAQVVVTSDIGRFLENDGYEFDFSDGYGMADTKRQDTVILGSGLPEQFGLQPRNTVRIGDLLDIARAFTKYGTIYCESTGQSLAFVRIEEYYDQYKTEIEQILDKKSESAEVIGTVRTQSGNYAYTMFTAGTDNAASGIGSIVNMDLVEFSLADDGLIKEMRQRGMELTHEEAGAFVMETEKRESVVRTSNLLNSLYPAVLALALLIGSCLCVLIILQSTKEAAIMRALGTTKRTTRSMLAVEQILLGVAGILLGLLVMLAWKRAAFAPIAVQAGLFAAAYVLVLVLGSYVSAGIATRKNILELLQTKE